MSGRRTIFALCAIALLIAGGVWFLRLRSPGPAVDPGTAGASAPEDPSERVAVASPEAAGDPVEPADDSARDLADSAATARDVDDLTLDGLLAIDDGPRTKITGRVVDPEGKPVAESATVLASTKRTLSGALLDAPVNRDRVQSGATDAAGRFELAQLDPGMLRIAVRAPGFAPLDAPEISLPAGSSFDVGELRLARGVILSGRVLDPDLRPVPSASISLVSAPLLGPVHRLGAFAEPQLGESDEAGRFELSCVAPGKHTLRVQHQDFPDALFETECSIDETHVDGLEFVLPRPAWISGDILDFDSAAMRDLMVTATPLDGLKLFELSKPEGASLEWLAGTRSEPVDEYGRFTVGGLDPGRTYSLRASRKANRAAAAEEEIQDRWAPPTLAQAGAVGLKVCYRPGSRLDFEVVDRSGEQLERLSIRLVGMLPAVPVDERGKPRTVFPGGVVSLLDLRASGVAEAFEPGPERDEQAKLSLTIESPGHDSRTLDGLRLEPGQRLALGMVRLDALSVLQVRVLDAATRAPLAGARVVLTADQPDRYAGRKSSVATTQAKGLALLTSLPTLSSTLTVTCDGFAPLTVAAPPSVNDSSQPVEISLLRSARVTARVRDTRGAKIAAAAVELRNLPGPLRAAWSRVQRTDSQGTTVFSDMPDGDFTIAVQPGSGLTYDAVANGLGSPARSLRIQGGDELDVELEIAALSSLSGSLWRGREPLAGALISFSSSRFAFRDIGTDLEQFLSAPRLESDANGEFKAAELAPGDWTLLIEHPRTSLRTRRVVHVEKLPTSVIIDVDDTQITGRVLDQRAQPVADAAVQLFADRPGRRTDIRPSVGDFLVPQDDLRRPVAATRTDAEGFYRLGSVPPGVPLEIFFSRGKRAASYPRVNVPQGSVLENINARLPDGGALEIILVAPIPSHGLHYGVRVSAIRQPEGLALDGALFDGNNRAHFDDLPPGEWVVMIFALDPAEQVVERREPQMVVVKSNQLTEFSVGW